MKVIYTTHFLRHFQKLSDFVKKDAAAREEIFRQDPFVASLKTHKLKGQLKDFWSFSVNYDYRIIFEFADSDTVYFHSIGQHDIYD